MSGDAQSCLGGAPPAIVCGPCVGRSRIKMNSIGSPCGPRSAGRMACPSMQQQITC